MAQKHLAEVIVALVVLLAFLSIGLAIAASNVQLPLGQPLMIGIKLADDWQTIQANSTYHFGDTKPTDTGYATDTNPVELRYTDPQHPLVLQNARGIYFAFKNGHVTRVQASQYGEEAEWDTTAQTVCALVPNIERAGWTQKTPHETTDAMLERARAYYANPTFQNMMNDYALKLWRIDNAWLEIGLYRSHSAGDMVQGRALPNNRYTINLRIVQNDE